MENGRKDGKSPAEGRRRGAGVPLRPFFVPLFLPLDVQTGFFSVLLIGLG